MYMVVIILAKLSKNETLMTGLYIEDELVFLITRDKDYVYYIYSIKDGEIDKKLGKSNNPQELELKVKYYKMVEDWRKKNEDI